MLKVRGLARIVDDATRMVTDADEEVFLLYTCLATKSVADGSRPFAGLGYMDSNTTKIAVKFELSAPPTPAAVRKQKGGKRSRPPPKQIITEVELVQDPTALRSRKGDTGSVLWKLSVCFAQKLLQQYHFEREDALLDAAALSNAHVLELGAGTGLLSIILSPLVHRYTATDVGDLVPLMRKNIGLNLPTLQQSKVTVEELDWLQLKSTPLVRRPKLFEFPLIDLLLVIDCVYHPSLIPSLVETINHLTTREKTVVLVAVELRAEDVVRQFLELWIGVEEGWEIWSITRWLADESYAVWIGWKKNSTSS